MTPTTRLVEVRQRILKENDVVARSLRQRFLESGLYVVSLVSVPGNGKTSFLEATLRELRHEFRIAALVGDLATENDAQRLAQPNVPVRQITTGTLCHLEAKMIEQALADWDLKQLDLLFVENVGNLVCPASFDLGETLRLVLFSSTEGEDKPLKYPTILHTADVAVISKIDLATAVDFDTVEMHRNIQSARPGMLTLEVSAKRGDGMQGWLELLRLRQRDFRDHPSAAEYR